MLEKVIRFEKKRQGDLLEKRKKVPQETRGLRGMTGETVSQRFKEGSADYRYFPEPDLPPIEIDDTWIERISEEITELPYERRKRFMEQYGVTYEVAQVITENTIKSDWFESAVQSVSKEIAREVANWFIGDFKCLKKKSGKKFSELIFKPNYLAELVELVKGGKVSGFSAKQILAESFKTGKAPHEVVKEKGLEQVNDEGELEEVIKKVIKANPKAVEDYKKGKVNVLQFLLGQVMRDTKGKANPKVVMNIIKEILK